MIEFANFVNVNDGTGSPSMLFPNVPIAANGTFSSTSNGDIDGAFYGTGHTEVGGTFNQQGIIGAFGGTRQ